MVAKASRGREAGVRPRPAATHRGVSANGPGRVLSSSRPAPSRLANELANVVHRAQRTAPLYSAGLGLEAVEPLPVGVLRTIQRDENETTWVPFEITFSEVISGAEFCRRAELQIFGREINANWKKVAASYQPKQSPVTARVPASLLARIRGQGHADLRKELEKGGAGGNAGSREQEFRDMPVGREKSGLVREIDRRYWEAAGVRPGTKIRNPKAEAGRVKLWNQMRDEVLLERRFVQNLPEEVQLILRYAPDGLKIGPKNYAQVVRIARDIAKMDAADLENYLRNVKKGDSLDDVEKALESFRESKKAAEKKIEEVMDLADSGDWDVDSEAAQLTESQMFYLTIAQRKKLIDQISDGFLVGGEDERTLINLITSCPTAQRSELIKWLKSDKAKMLKRLESVIDDDENAQYYAALRNLLFHELKPEDLLKKIQSAKILPWSDPGLIKASYTVRVYYETIELTDKGKVKVVFWVNIGPLGVGPTTRVFDPDEVVGLHFLSDEDFANAKKGQIIFMPAANLIAFKNKQFRRELNLVVDVGLLGMGGAGLIAKGGRLAKAVAALDVALAASDIVINSFRAEIARTAAGKEFLRSWDTVQTLIGIYGLARVVLSLPRVFRNLKAAYHRFRASKHGLDPNDINKVDRDTSKLLSEAESVTFEKRLDNLKAKHSSEELDAFASELEKVAGIADHKKRAAALDVVESQMEATKHNRGLVEKLRTANPKKSNKEIADLAKAKLKTPGVPIGYSPEEWSQVQAWVKKYLESKGHTVKQGFATGSRVTGTTFNPKKATFGKAKSDFEKSDLDITVVTDKNMSKSQANRMISEFSKAFGGRRLGVRHLPESQIGQLKHIPIYGKIDMKF